MNAQSLPGKKKKAARTLPLPYWLREFGLIQRAVLTFAGTLFISLAALFASRWYLIDARDYRAQAERARAAAYTRYAQVDNEKREIREYQPRFLELRNQGLVGEENRLNWLDAIHQVQEQRHLLPISYEIAPQQTFTVDGQLTLGDYLLRGSRMRLHMDVLHELDLFNFLEDLQRRGYFGVQDCSIQRLTVAANAPAAPTLSADCTLAWLTLTPAAAAPKTFRRRKHS